VDAFKAAMNLSIKDEAMKREVQDTIQVVVEAIGRASQTEANHIIPGMQLTGIKRAAVFRYQESPDAAGYFAPLLWAMVQQDIDWPRYTDMY
jgi:hypothetical protein